MLVELTKAKQKERRVDAKKTTTNRKQKFKDSKNKTKHSKEDMLRRQNLTEAFCLQNVKDLIRDKDN